MKPLPALKLGHSNPGDSPASQQTIDLKLSSSTGPESGSLPPSCSISRVYPWLLVFSTAVAGAFCFLYLTKPFIQPTSNSSVVQDVPALATTPRRTPTEVKEVKNLLPNPDRLPGDTAPVASTKLKSRDLPASAKIPTAYEPTNLRIQHIITAEAPGGYQAKINLEVPVLYQSRNLRWTNNEVEASRKLLVQLKDYQEKSRNLRLEGIELQAAWSRLIETSIPAGDLRADSPTLITNQRAAETSSNSSDSIQPPKK